MKTRGHNKTPSYLKDKLPSKHRPFFNSPLFTVFREIKFKTNTVDSRYLDYSLSRTFRYLELFSRSLEHFAVTQVKILSLSRTSICRTFRYLELIFRSFEEQTFVISNFSKFFCFEFQKHSNSYFHF